MKNWILTHKLLTVILACVRGVGAVCAVAIPLALRHKHEFSAEWSYDDTYHFHKCLDEKCEEVADKAEHVFDKEVVADKYFVSEATYTEAAKYYKSCLCGAKGKETFNSGSTLSAKDNDVNLKEGVTLGKTYDGEAFNLAAEEIVRNGDGVITFMYKLKDSEAEYALTAPVKAGEYTVKVSVAATAEWKEAEKTFDFTIAKKSLTATATKPYDGNATMSATLTGVLDGETVTATITMTSKNVGATVKEVMLEGADKDNYMLTAANVTASITVKTLTAKATKPYDGNATMSATLTGVLDGETVTATITMTSKNVGATVKEVMLEGADKDNYTLTAANVTASITAKTLTAKATKTYDGTIAMPVTLTGVVAGETVTATITMTSKNVGATVKEVMLEGADKDNYMLTAATVTASITAKTLKATANKTYDGNATMSATLTGVLDGETVNATITMASANVGAAVQSFEFTGKDAANYSLAREDVNVEIVKADIKGFTISNADAFNKIVIGAQSIPNPTTNYVETGTGYGEMTIVWEKQLEGGVWSRNLTKEEVIQSKTGTFQVRIQYAEGDNYKFGATPSVKFTMKAKSRTLAVRNFTGKTYDGKPVENFTYENLVYKLSTPSIEGGVEHITPIPSGEKYVEYRKQGEALWTKVTDTYIPKNAAVYEYRIGITATDEWEAVFSEIRSFTIAQVEIKLEKGYVAISNNLQNGELFLATHSPVAGESVALRLVNEKAGLELTAPGSGYLKKDQKKQVSVQNNLDCFKLVKGTNTNINNYKLVKSTGQTSVEIAVVPSGKGASNQIQEAWKSTDGKQLFLDTSVKTGYFMVGQTVEIYDSTGTNKLFEAKIVRVHVGIGTNSQVAQSGCVIPSDGMVRIDIDVTGITYSGAIKGGTVRVK